MKLCVFTACFEVLKTYLGFVLLSFCGKDGKGEKSHVGDDDQNATHFVSNDGCIGFCCRYGYDCTWNTVIYIY